jgi:outer membrane protein OmpA-like peptidoglycan-associated protein/ABC-type nitrate/sulfonate/bicarbonate transport system substrate-binding protein
LQYAREAVNYTLSALRKGTVMKQERSDIMKKLWVFFVFVVALLPYGGWADSFKDAVGPVQLGEVSQTVPLQVPFILWGGDVATFQANGGLKTRTGSTFDQLGLNLNLTPGDDVVQQVRDYLSGKSPFIRCTMRMAGIISEVIAQDPRTNGVVFLQMTWSAGDHMVSREGVTKANDLKGKTVALQEFGPHVGMLDDILKSANLSWKDVNVVWTKDITGPGGPAERFRKEAGIDACFVITPDMIGLTGGPDIAGSGAEGTVKGAKVCISTAEMSRSIADVYLCRKDFFDANQALVEKFMVGYLKGCEQVVKLRKQFQRRGSEDYMALLKTTQEIYGADAIPTLEEDAHGLILDCQYVGQPGNVAFFYETGNLRGFKAFNDSALSFALANGYIASKKNLLSSTLDLNGTIYKENLSTYIAVAGLKAKREAMQKFNAEAVRSEIAAFGSGDILDDRTLVSFTIGFAPDQTEFDPAQYRNDFLHALDVASKFGNAVVLVEGHSDPTKCLAELVRAGLKKGILKRTGSRGDYRYFLKGKPLNFEQTAELVAEVEAGSFDGVAGHNPRQIMVAAKNLSLQRADAVRQEIANFATAQGIVMDKSQMQPVGVGIVNPVVAKPTNADEAAVNRRVEFKIVKVSAEAVSKDDFDF